MISAVDTNILLDIARPNPDFLADSLELIEQAGNDGSLVVCPLVHAELSAHFSDQITLSEFLSDFAIRVDTFSEHSTWEAGQCWRNHRKAGGKRDRIIPDFLIGSHAQHQAGRLLTRDRGFYHSYFARLKVAAKASDLRIH